MFGIIRPCRHRLGERLLESWTAHLCGLCLALRDGHGQLARTATNYDGLIVSVLVEAQTASRPDARRTAGPCPLRGLRTAPVARGEGARLAAAVSLALASAKMRDHVDDADGVFARRPVAVAAGGVAERWRRQSRSAGTALGFDPEVLFASLSRQAEVEAAAGIGSSVLLVTAPTEEATALALEHTAVLAGRPGNRAPLREVGRYFGRLAHLLDAVEDLTEDQANGAWNPLVATGTSLAEAERLCRDAVHGIRLALAEVEVTDGALVHRLLAHETDAAVGRVFGHAQAHGSRQDWTPPPMGPNPFGQPGIFPPPPPAPTRRNPLVACGLWAVLCCTCQACCREEYENPCTGRRMHGPCRDCDCDCCDCGDCCECCDGCDGCDGCDCCDCSC
ncbi:DUF5685 family protein [Streptacidiphilus jiangxiensis]|uniref:Regulatory protein n=1 Tax=Streptacidiphilus jiangxiensis TaxID=235985 RepID=A0A1H7IBV6_STRJI|nr:DUF5685 family protein [Streptacidiphilus jiangxiensis]SEK60011.1 hypothetical protein SAMN05414137_102594 [Streptacidiphilus jiangxiensis]